MKKFIMLIIAFSICIFPFSIAYAAPTPYAINKDNMTVNIPDGWDVFTQATDPNDKRLSKYGLDGKIIDSMKKYSITLKACYAKPNIQIDVWCLYSEQMETIYNLKLLTDDNVDFFHQSIIDGLKKGKEIDITDCQIYSNNNAKYSVIDFSYAANEIKIFVKQYVTIVNGQMVKIVLNSDEAISNQSADVIKNVVDSFTYVEDPNMNDKAKAFMQAQAETAVQTEPADQAQAASTDKAVPASGTAMPNAPSRAGFILIVLGGGVALALAITGIVILINKKGRAQYGSREIVISSDAYNTDTPDNSGGFIPPELTDRNGTRNADVAGEGQAAQPEDTKKTDGTEGTQETDGAYQTNQTDETNKPDAMGEAGQTKEAALFCNQCGAKVPENSRFCYRCGAPVYRD